MVILEGTPVSFRFLSNRRSYGAIDVSDEVAANGQLCPSKLTKFNFYFFDPLTSMLRPSRCTFDREKIHEIDIVPQLPVQHDFEIDRLSFFYDWTLRDYPGLPTGVMCDEVAQKFWRSFLEFLRFNSTALLSKPNREFDCIWKSDFTELGLDFMRQHYRSLKADAITRGGDISAEFLRDLLSDTKMHRTVDEDWIPKGFQNGTFVL
ncbi:MAG: hypothetical protein JNM43_28140 [Planctomycetaceae bacterium]|nr:hypothetical protein [Planctomycetaceae bacterium]